MQDVQQISVDELESIARWLYGGHWYERLGRKMRIRPRDFERMLNGEQDIPDDVVDVLIDGLEKRVSEGRAFITLLAGEDN